MMKLPNEMILSEAVSLLKQGKNVTIPISGNSMMPFLNPKSDAVTIAPPREELIRKGNIAFAAVSSDGRAFYVLHRIIKLEPLTLMGDANLVAKEIIGDAQLLGIAISRERNGRSTSLISQGQKAKSSLWHLTRPIAVRLMHRICRF